MSIREKLNQHRGFSGGVAVVIVLAAAAIVWNQLTSGPSYSAVVPNFYTTEDQSAERALAALFKDDTAKLPPFDKDGKPAYRAYVFTTDGGKTRFVGYLERYTPEGKQLLEAVQSGQLAELSTDQINHRLTQSGIEIKKPGDAEWVLQSNSARAARVLAIAPPDGGSLATLESVFP